MEETFPDIGSMSDQELKDLIDELTEEEQEVSYRRRILHGKIDILRAELVNRLRDKREEGEALITGDDVQQLTDILAGKARQPPTRPRSRAAAAGGQLMAAALPRVRVRQPRGGELLPEVRRLPGAPEEGGRGADDDDLQGRRDRRDAAGRHRGGGRGGRARRW